MDVVISEPVAADADGLDSAPSAVPASDRLPLKTAARLK